MSSDNSNIDVVRETSLVPETASDSAIRFLRAMIFSGELGPGDRLPPERDLGARLGISRMTLRLALKALESTGYIVTTRGSRGGSRIADAESLVQCWNHWMRQHANELNDLFEFRETVETRLADLAAKNRTNEDLELIEQAVAREGYVKEWSSLFRADMDIHRSIAQAAHSPRLERAMLAARGEFFVPVDLARFEDRENQVHDSHASILSAIRDQDSAAAAEEMHRHMAIVRDLTDKALAASGIVPAKH